MNPPFRMAPYLPVRIKTERRKDGSILIENLNPLRPPARHMLEPLAYWAASAPDRVFLAERHVDGSPGWRTLTYQAAWRQVRAVAQGLLERDLAGPENPVMILSRNGIDHAVLSYAALMVGAPVCPVTPAYSLLSEDFERLKHALDLIKPTAVYVEDGAQFARALAVAGPGRTVITSRNGPDEALRIEHLIHTPVTRAVDDTYARLAPDTISKYMLTSGSTGRPKAVINTHGMIAANAAMIRSVYDPALEARQADPAPIMVNFLPWSHTFGANAILHYILAAGGTLYVDWGAPTPDRLGQMLANLGEVSATHHTTVPAAWAALATELERDEDFARVFFSKLAIMAYGGASMGQDIYERVQAVAIRVTGERITLSAGYGATETAPTTANVHWLNDKMGLIGLPIPGVQMKLAPVAGKYECRVRGPHITPGYLNEPVRTAEAFDEEGYYKLGDAVRPVDPDRIEAGLAFDGRIAEDFKLASGAWVTAGKVRVDLVEACDGPLSDAVICGLNADHIGALGFLNPGWCRRLVGEDLPLAALAGDSRVRGAVAAGLARYNAAHPNPAARVKRLLLMPDAPLADAGEITDKGYLNQAICRDRRPAAVAALYRPEGPDGVIDL
jgi:feruloyl-CoA synthase